MKIFSVLFATLLLASCSKDNDTKPSGANNLTGIAKEVNDIVWGNPSPSGSNHLVIDKTSEFLNTNTGEVHSFGVENSKAFTSTNEGEGSGVSYTGEGHEIRVVKLTLNPAQLVVRCFVGGKEVMSRGWAY
jgi:hypothetical protein